MQLAIAGWPVAGRSESLLDIITKRLRSGCRKLLDTLKQKGRP
ncbi:protease FtsH-inhibitory lysogeny factor CIII [Erwinia tracheiphila]|uniref:Protease FtsH-inhibitory lysogeny factor CIII n=1 Tax=Erwinia tracheiphila TaxID=65700 RepID=A0A345CRM6_9GAMM|nr:protease FtsH-inhibitory lysogeny factor CIII [Erwinia tracheiphila]AXF76093.1 protease FtsH-inhibitory lysogeny factor CIII [Erwinia tracheiphila]UIA85246.1 protease FtsH-inhibitory lysogeny factor CIII [Erwinia tracheiphila]